MRASAASAPPAGGRLKLTSEGLAWFGAAAVLGLLGWSKSLNLLLMLSYVMVALLVLNGVAARRHANRVRARRIVPPPVFAGESSETVIVVSNASSKRASVVVADRDHLVPCSELDPGRSESFATTETFPTRGRIVLPPLLVGSSSPFGFLRHDNPQSAEDAIAVLPALGTVDADALRQWLIRMAGGDGRSRKMVRRVTHEQADVRGIRAYRPGDSLRTIHWRSSARRRELMVREYDAAPSPELLLVVEPWLPAEPTAADRSNLEAALSRAATIAFAWCHDLASRMTLVVGANVMPASAANLRHALIPLAEAEGAPEPQMPRAASLPRSVLRSARLVVSSRASTGLADALARELGRPFAVVDSSHDPYWHRPPAGKEDAA